MYIAIEGTKGTGKSTLLDNLNAALKYDEIQYCNFNTTKAMPADSWLEQAYVHYAENDQFIEHLYTARANYHAQRTDFNLPLVLGDRSILTSIVTRWPYAMDQLDAYVHRIRQQEYAVPTPDCVFYLDLDVKKTLTRLEKRQRSYGIYDESVERLIHAKYAYSCIFKQKDRFFMQNMKIIKINADQSAKKIFDQVYSILLEQIENKSLCKLG